MLNGSLERGDRTRFAMLVLIMAALGLATAAIAITVLYKAAAAEQRSLLFDTVVLQAELIEAMGRFDRQQAALPDEARTASLARLRETLDDSAADRAGRPATLLIAQRSPAGLEVLRDRSAGGTVRALPPDAEAAAPIKRALGGDSGTMQGVDAQGRPVLAAYRPVPSLDLAVVAQLPLQDLRRPYLRAGAIAGAVGLLLIGSGMVLFFAVGEPMLRRLRDQGEVYRRLFDSSPSPQFLVDPHTATTIAANDPLAELLGYAREELAEKPISVYEAREGADEIVLHVKRIMSRSSDEFETLWRTKDGALLTVLINVRVLELSGRPVLHCVATDITERVRTEKRIRDLTEQLQKIGRANELGQMVALLAHELKQPLTAALNYVNAVHRTVQAESADQRLATFAANAADQIERSNSIIGSLRNYIRCGEPFKSSEDINRIVRETIVLVTGTSMAEGIDVRLSLTEELPPVFVDRLQIQQVLVNLLRNAIEATASVPIRMVAVETRAAVPEGIEVVVRDSGPGLAAEIVERLFQPFVTTKPDGLGIGLSISQTIITNHGGRLWAEPVDAGALFRLIIPAARSFSGSP